MSRKDREAIESERHDLTESLMEHIGDLLVKVRTYVCIYSMYIRKCVTTSLRTTWTLNRAPLGCKFAQVL